MKSIKKLCAVFAAGAFRLTALGAAQAQTYPSGPVKKQQYDQLGMVMRAAA